MEGDEDASGDTNFDLSFALVPDLDLTLFADPEPRNARLSIDLEDTDTERVLAASLPAPPSAGVEGVELDSLSLCNDVARVLVLKVLSKVLVPVPVPELPASASSAASSRVTLSGTGGKTGPGDDVPDP